MRLVLVDETGNTVDPETVEVNVGDLVVWGLKGTQNATIAFHESGVVDMHNSEMGPNKAASGQVIGSPNPNVEHEYDVKINGLVSTTAILIIMG